MLIGIEYKKFTLLLKFAYTSKSRLLGKLFYHMPGRPVRTLIENHCMKEKKMDEGCRNNTRTSSLLLCTAPPDASGKRKRGKESKKWNEQQSYDKICFDYEKYERTDGPTDPAVLSA